MFEEYRKDWSGITLSGEADERIRRMLEENIAEKPVKIPPKVWKTVLIAAALCVLLIGSVWGVSGFNFSEISQTIRIMNDIESGAVLSYRSYETVTVEESALYTDVHHEGKGELYLNDTVYHSENLITIYLYIHAVTKGQYESYDWRAQIEGREEYIVVEPVEDRTGRKEAVMRLAILAEEDVPESFRLTVYGGHETENGSGFCILRQGYTTVDVPAKDEMVELVFEDGIELWDEESGISAAITKAEVHNQQLILYYHVPGMDDMWERADGNWNDPEALKWMNGLLDMSRDIEVVFTDGTRMPWLPSSVGTHLPGDVYIDGMTWGSSIFSKYKLEDVESVIIAGEVYEIEQAKQSAAK